MGAGYDISLSSSEALSQDSHAVFNVGGGLRPQVVIILAALALIAFVAWATKGRR